jgi:hypothetical protein
MDLSLRLGRWHLTVSLHRKQHDGWYTTQLDDRTLHVHPIRDSVVHTLDEDCPCGPTAEHVPPDAWMYTHHSLDGRERFE